jgi:hypothetical protein
LTVGLGVLHHDQIPFCQIEYVEWVRNTLEKVFSFVRQHSAESVRKQKQQHDKTCRSRDIRVGDYVWRWYPPKANQKLGLGWVGPCKVVEKVGESAVKVKTGKNGKVIVIHLNDTKPYEG